MARAYKTFTIVNYAHRLMLQIVTSHWECNCLQSLELSFTNVVLFIVLAAGHIIVNYIARGVIYDCNMFKVNGTCKITININYTVRGVI